MNNDLSKCSWMPAAFLSNSNIKIYGDVALTASIELMSDIKEILYIEIVDSTE